MKKLATVVVAVTFAAACGGSDGNSGTGEWNGTVRDSAGVTVVANGSGSVWSGHWGAEETLRVGSIEDPDYQFGNIVGVVADDEGNFYVGDQQAREVKVYDSTGTYLRTIGRPGEGPGEFGVGMAQMTIVGDTLMVFDQATQRVNRFDLQGEPLEAVSTPFAGSAPVLLQFTSDGRVYQQLRRFLNPQQGPAGGIDSLDVIVKRNRDGSTGDTLMILQGGQTFSAQGIKIFSPEPVWAILDDNSVVAGRNDNYELTIHSSDGAPTDVFRRDVGAREVTDSDKETLLNALIGFMEDQGIPPQALQQIRGSLSFADQYPMFVQILSGPSGSMWLRRPRIVSEMDPAALESFNILQDIGSPNWDVFDRDGKFLGVVEFPDRFTLLNFEDSHALGVWRDDLDVQYLMKLRLLDADGNVTSGFSDV